MPTQYPCFFFFTRQFSSCPLKTAAKPTPVHKTNIPTFAQNRTVAISGRGVGGINYPEYDIHSSFGRAPSAPGSRRFSPVLRKLTVLYRRMMLCPLLFFFLFLRRRRIPAGVRRIYGKLRVTPTSISPVTVISCWLGASDLKSRYQHDGRKCRYAWDGDPVQSPSELKC